MPHPESDAYAIGPLARRLLLLLGEAPEGDLSAQAWFDRMTDGDFDPQSVAGHFEYAVEDPGAALVPAKRPTIPVEGMTRRGSEGGSG
jgi:hypothetical protein